MRYGVTVRGMASGSRLGDGAGRLWGKEEELSAGLAEGKQTARRSRNRVSLERVKEKDKWIFRT